MTTARRDARTGVGRPFRWCGLVPFFIAYLIALAIITYWPPLSLYLPNMLMR
jgi:TRAP-type C4-dicarboxylate transport system permease large subunit